MTPTPDRDIVLAAIELANHAPSVHNTQPWRWLLGALMVHQMADHPHRPAVRDPGGRDLLLSCGAALHHLRVAFAALGWRATVHHLPDEHDPVHLAAVEPHPHVPTGDDVALSQAITRRRTDRRRFTFWDVPAEHLDLIVRAAERAGGLLVPVTDRVTRARLVRAIDADADADADAQDGPPEPIWPSDTTLGPFARGTLHDAPPGHGEPDGSLVLVLTTPHDDPASVLRAGEAASAALLTATDLGLATCALSQPLEITDIRATIRDQVLDGTAHPHLILRVGWAPVSAPLLPHSPVRHTDETFDYLPGASET